MKAEDGHQHVVCHSPLAKREVMTGISPIAVSQPDVCDSEADVANPAREEVVLHQRVGSNMRTEAINYELLSHALYYLSFCLGHNFGRRSGRDGRAARQILTVRKFDDRRTAKSGRGRSWASGVWRKVTGFSCPMSRFRQLDVVKRSAAFAFTQKVALALHSIVHRSR
ncbi:hypothetical protein BSZ19_12220 [Bradyrhizobium japonicum]|uniref:Uncharacterized protein n=1 Tax=Bradyrhizobium japonicum TaxID=375 RepID=A0A1Y2JRY7_BRAJP|nr:hypothetical protein BSZ19_12220 [Bradyrhizobium japonicum]